MSYDIVMLTNGNPHGLKILEKLISKGIKIKAVVYESHPHLRDCIPSDSMDPVMWLKGGKRWLFRKVEALKTVAQFKKVHSNVILTGPINSTSMIEILMQLEPDFIVLGGIGILKQQIIDIARQGVINAHPGLLPWIRGSGVVGSAIERGIPIGGTCHYVNSGIDKGKIIERRLLPVSCSYSTLFDLERAADELVVQMMVDLISESIFKGYIPDSVEQFTAFPICKYQSPEQREAINNQVRCGRAKEYFDTWKLNCVGSDRYILPNNFMEAPK